MVSLKVQIPKLNKVENPNRLITKEEIGQGAIILNTNTSQKHLN